MSQPAVSVPAVWLRIMSAKIKADTDILFGASCLTKKELDKQLDDTKHKLSEANAVLSNTEPQIDNINEQSEQNRVKRERLQAQIKQVEAVLSMKPAHEPLAEVSDDTGQRQLSYAAQSHGYSKRPALEDSIAMGEDIYRYGGKFIRAEIDEDAENVWIPGESEEL